jgi:hypothetical protein
LNPTIDRRGTYAVAAAFAALLVIVAAPLFSTVLPPLVDYPNHLARLHLIAEGGNRFYQVRWAPLPDLAADLVVPGLVAGVGLPLALAGKLFLAMIFGLIAGGAAWLNRAATGRWRMWPLLAFLLLYSRVFLWGFINYLFGLGVALCGIALWLALEERRGPRVLASIVVALACFFSHIAAFGVYAVAIAGVELVPVLGLLRSRRFGDIVGRIAAAAAQFVLPAIILWRFEPASPDQPIGYGAIWRKADLLFSVFDDYSRPFDVVCFVLFVGLLGALAWKRRLEIAPRLGTALALLLVVYLLSPTRIFTGYGADHRLPIALFLMFVAATSPVPPLSRRAALLVGVAVAAIFAARMAVVEAIWLKSDAVYTDDLRVLGGFPLGAKIAVGFPPRDINAGGIPQLHVPVLAVERDAFVPTLFAFPTQQPLLVRPPYDRIALQTSPSALWAAFVEDDAAARAQIAPILGDYDFILLADRERFVVPPRPCLRRMPSTPSFQVFALSHDQGCF